jgi:hypothetical protein
VTTYSVVFWPYYRVDTGTFMDRSADYHIALPRRSLSTRCSAVGNPFAGLRTGAREVLRTLSYYEMENRAGLIGQQGLGPLPANLAGPSGAPRIHLIGHSLGARLVCLRPVRIGLRGVVGITCRT